MAQRRCLFRPRPRWLQGPKRGRRCNICSISTLWRFLPCTRYLQGCGGARPLHNGGVPSTRERSAYTIPPTNISPTNAPGISASVNDPQPSYSNMSGTSVQHSLATSLKTFRHKTVVAPSPPSICSHFSRACSRLGCLRHSSKPPEIKPEQDQNNRGRFPGRTCEVIAKLASPVLVRQHYHHSRSTRGGRTCEVIAKLG